MAEIRCKMEKKLTTHPPNTKFNTNISVVFTFPWYPIHESCWGHGYIYKFKINSLKKFSFGLESLVILSFLAIFEFTLIKTKISKKLCSP
jgi:hypothetical protein